MRRYLLVGALVFVVAAIVVAPAGLLTRLIAPSAQINLVDTRGSVWQGEARLLALGGDVGALTWQVRPGSVFALEPTFDWRLTSSSMGLNGTATSGFSATSLTAIGGFGADALNPYLNAYDIHLNGSFEVTPTLLEFVYSPPQLRSINGQIDWSGGNVRFTLANQLHEVDMPPLSAKLGADVSGAPHAVVVQQGDATPLMVVSASGNGFIKIGITKMFTKLLRNPWPGSDADHVVVLEVEEQLL